MRAAWRQQRGGQPRPRSSREPSFTSKSSSKRRTTNRRFQRPEETATVSLLGSVFDELKTIRRNVDRTRHEGLHHQSLIQSENAMLEKALKHAQQECSSLRIALKAVKEERENGRERKLEARLSRSEWERKALVQKLQDAREDAALKQDRIEQLIEEVGAMTTLGVGEGEGTASRTVDLRLQESILAQLERSKSMLLGARSEIANLMKDEEEEEEEQEEQEEQEKREGAHPSSSSSGQTKMTVHELAASAARQHGALALSEMSATARLEERVTAIESRAQQAVGRLQASQHALSLSKENASRLECRVAELDGQLKLSEERRRHAEEGARRAEALAEVERRQRLAAEHSLRASRSEFAILEGRLREALRAEAEAARSLERWRSSEVVELRRSELKE